MEGDDPAERFSFGLGTIHNRNNVGHIGLGRCRECESIKNGRQVATRDVVQGGAFANADLRFAKLAMRRSQAIGQITWKCSWEMESSADGQVRR